MKIAQRFSAGSSINPIRLSPARTTDHAFVYQLLDALRVQHEGAPTILTADVRARLWPYLGGTAREHGMKALAVGGVADHVHVLVSLRAPMALSKAVQILKENSSKWLQETFPVMRDMSWQEGYGAFSIGASVAYIRNQEEYHRVRTFREELEGFLRRNGLVFEPSMLD